MSLEYPGGPKVITSILIKEGRRSRKGGATMLCFEDGRRRLGSAEGGNGKEAGCCCSLWKERSTVD